MQNAKKLPRKSAKDVMDDHVTSRKEVLEEEINYLIAVLYKLSKGINERESDMADHKDPELQAIYVDDIKALTKDFLMIVEQINLRLEEYVKICNGNHIPIELDYFRLYKMLKAFVDQ